MKQGRIDIHSHLLPGIDDGCENVGESVECARQLVAAGYTHCFCTPHIWKSLPNNRPGKIPAMVDALQQALNDARIPLTLLPGGENNFTELSHLADGDIVTYQMANRWVLIDIWTDILPRYFYEQTTRLKERGLQIILAHPERMRAVQDDPGLATIFQDLGLLLQGNLQCFADAPATDTRRTAELFLTEGRYTFLGSDLHNTRTLPHRLTGLQNAINLGGSELVDQLTIENPRRLIEDRG
jgi:protein-tyrosine phosphatase